MSTSAVQIRSQFDNDFSDWKKNQRVFYLTPANEEHLKKVLWLFYVRGRWDEEQSQLAREEFPDVLYLTLGGD